MTSFSGYTGVTLPLRNVLFSDFVSDTTPFGVARSNLNAQNFAGSSISNGSTDGLGILTLTVGSGAASGVQYARCGAYLAESAVGGAIDRLWRIDRSECYVESRVKTDCSNANTVVTVGFGLGHATAGLVVADYLVGFYAFGNEANWTAAVVSASSVVVSKTLSIPKKDFAVLSVQVGSDGRSVFWEADGVEVFRTILSSPFFVDGNTALPQVEIRDKTAGGSAGGAQNVFVDYMLLADKPITPRF